MKKVVNLYWVDWYKDGFCYRSTSNCKWEDVLNCKRVAKRLGEKITYEKYDKIVYEY
jgi:hypothetical protein